MSVTKPIPKPLRDEMENDPFYQRCCVTGIRKGPYTKIEWHHNFISYQNGNKGRVNEKWCILPLYEGVHKLASRSDIKKFLDWIMLNRADDATLRRWSKADDLIKRRERLNKHYANEKNHPVL